MKKTIFALALGLCLGCAAFGQNPNASAQAAPKQVIHPDAETIKVLQAVQPFYYGHFQTNLGELVVAYREGELTITALGDGQWYVDYRDCPTIVIDQGG